MCMERLDILLVKNSNECEQIKKSIRRISCVDIEEINYDNFTNISMTFSSDNKNELLKKLSEIFYYIWKFRYLETYFKDTNLGKYDIYAFVGALLSVDSENEKRVIRTTIKNIKSIALDSLYYFRLKKLLDAWESLVTVACTLIKNIDTPEDLYELISYFLSNVEQSTRITITDTIPQNIVISGEIYHPIDFTIDENLNLLLSVIMRAPSHVVIKNQEVLSKDLLDTFRALGRQ